MSAISLKSITGITSITTPAGVDDQLTLHTNDTTQRVKVTQSGMEVVGVATFQDIDVDGHTNLDNVNIAGVTTTGAVSWGGHMIPTSNAVYDIGTAEKKVRHLFLSDNSLKFVDSSDTEHPLSVDSGRLKFAGGLLLGNSIKADVVSGILTATTFKGDGDFVDIDVDGHTNLDNVSIAGVVTATQGVRVTADGSSSSNYISVGASDDLRIFHSGVNEILSMNGALYLKGDASNVIGIQPRNGENSALFFPDGAVKLYYDNESMLETEVRGAFVKRVNGSDTTFTVGSTDASGVRICLDGDSNGDAYGNDYAFLQHDSSGDFIISADNPAGNSNLILKTGNSNERLRIDSTGRVLIGTDTARAVGGESNPRLHIEGSGATSNSWMNITRFSANNGSANIQFAKSRSNTPGTYTIVQDDDILGQISFLGADGTDMANYAALIRAQVDGTPGSNNMPGRLIFSTTADGGTFPTERLRVNSSGQLLSGVTGNAGAADANAVFGGGNAGSGNYGKLYITQSQSNPSANTAIGFIGFSNQNLSNIPFAFMGVYADADHGTNDYPSRISFWTTPDGSSSSLERLRITSSGNVGINDSNPDNQLVVKSVSGHTTAKVTSGDETTSMVMQAIQGSEGRLGMNTNHPLAIYAGGLEKLRITSGGRVLIGTTSELSFNGVGQYHNLIVAGTWADTDITDNSHAAITISNKDGTAGNTAGLHFAREDTDGNPHYDGASIVAQFKETMNTGQYPKADLVFLTSTANNNAPSEKLRIAADGNVGVGNFSGSNVPQKLSIFGNMYMRQGDYITWNNGDCDIGGISGYHLRFRTYTGSSMTEKMQITSKGIITTPIGPLNYNSATAAAIVNTSGRQLDNGNDFSTNYKQNLSVGWYTIATNTGGRAWGKIGIRETYSSRHQAVTIFAGHHYGGSSDQNSLHTISSGRHSGNPLGAVRIKAYGTYDGAMLQVYLRDGSNGVQAYLLGDNIQTHGWKMKDWIADGTDPGDLGNWTAINNNGGNSAYADLNNTQAGGTTTDGHIIPGRDNATDLGTPSYRFDDVFATNTTIQGSSDERLKQDIAALTTAEMNAAKRMSALFKTYRWKDRVLEKGDKARTHTGVIAQQVKAALEAEGLDPTKYGFYGFDEWYEDSEGTKLPIDAPTRQGDPVGINTNTSLGGSIVVPDGFEKKSLYSIRIGELLAFIAAYNEQRFTSIESRLTALESS